jgi:uncharacterized repeat protein (TIGR01451 family)
VSDPNLANNSATDSDAVNAMADLSITKTGAAASPGPGDSIIYTIAVSNAGRGEVTKATVVDVAPAGLSFGSWSCTVSNPGSGGTVTTACSAASGSGNINTTVTMKVGAVIVYTVSATVASDAVGSITNIATVTPATGMADPTPANNSATVTLSISGAEPIPVLGPRALALLTLLLCALAARSMRLARRR